MITKRLAAAAALVGIVSAAAFAQSDPLIGTWTLNAAKSKGAKSGSTTVEQAGDGVTFTVDLVGADGTARHWTFTAKYDGKDVPVKGNSPYGDVVALTRVDPNTVRMTNKQGGKVTATITIVVAADGKSRTTTVKGTDAQGQAIDVVSFYDKQ